NQHDILTGSTPDGRAFTDAADHTCSNYTSNATVQPPAAGQTSAPGPSVQLGHHDRLGGANASWNSVHASRGCSQPNLVSTGGAGLLYCFATGAPAAGRGAAVGGAGTERRRAPRRVLGIASGQRVGAAACDRPLEPIARLDGADAFRRAGVNEVAGAQVVVLRQVRDHCRDRVDEIREIAGLSRLAVHAQLDAS